MGIRRTEALDSLRSHDLIGIGMEADAVRRRLHPEGVVTYAVIANLRANDPAMLCQSAAAASARGASGVALLDTAKLGPEHLPQLLASLRRQLPAIWIEALTPEDVHSLAAAASRPATELLHSLRNAGLDSLLPEPLPLGGEPAARTLNVHRAAHRAGIRTIAVMSFAPDETPESRIEFLARIDALQQETGGFAAFLAEPVAPGLAGPTAVDSLKILAVARLMLDSIEHIRVTQSHGLKVLETGLRFGADDAGQIVLAPESAPDLREEDLRRIIRDAGLLPAERHPSYRALFAV